MTLALADEMVALAGVDADPGAHLANGSALAKYREMVSAQGGDADAALPEATQHLAVRAERSGYVTRLDAFAVGVAAWRLGAGAARKEDPVSPVAGVVCVAKEGDAVEEGPADPRPARRRSVEGHRGARGPRWRHRHRV